MTKFPTTTKIDINTEKAHNATPSALGGGGGEPFLMNQTHCSGLCSLLLSGPFLACNETMLTLTVLGQIWRKGDSEGSVMDKLGL